MGTWVISRGRRRVSGRWTWAGLGRRRRAFGCGNLGKKRGVALPRGGAFGDHDDTVCSLKQILRGRPMGLGP